MPPPQPAVSTAAYPTGAAVVSTSLRCTQPLIRIVSLFIDMRVSNALLGDAFVMASAGLSAPLIHLISPISQFLYDCLRLIILIISLFSVVVPSLIRHLYRE